MICDRALLGAYVQGKDRVDLKTLKTAAREVSGRGARRRQRIYTGIAASVLVALAAALGTAYYRYGSDALRETAAAKVVAEPVVSAKTESMQASLREAFDPAQVDTSDAAYQALFGAWQIDYSPKDGRTVCEQARRQGLQCVQGTGSISDLRQMNKPAVLRLLGAEGTDYYARRSPRSGGKT